MSGPVAQTEESRQFRGRKTERALSRHWGADLTKAEELAVRQVGSESRDGGDCVSAAHRLD